MTRIIWSRLDLERAEAANDATLCFSAPPSFVANPPGASFEQVFHDHYPALRRLLDGRVEPGLALLVVSANGVEASAWFAAMEAGINPLIVGRHGSAHVFLPSDPRTSLRHLALILHRRGGVGPVAFRVLDLRTPLAFADEEGSRLEAVEATGPLLLWCGSLGLLLFPTGAGIPPWPADAGTAWSQVPERRYVERTPAQSARAWAPDLGATTLVNRLAGPVFPTLVADESDPARGELLIASASGRTTVRLGPRASHRGVLLGRYERCETAGLPVLTDPGLSRVHLLVLEMDGVLYAIDTASKNGSWCGGEHVRATRMLPGLRVSLAGKATVEWCPFH